MKLKNTRSLSTLVFLITLSFLPSVYIFGQQNLSKQALIPRPVSVSPSAGYFEITENTGIYIEGKSAELKQVGQYLSDLLAPATGLRLEVKTVVKVPASEAMILSLQTKDIKLGDEGYTLTVTPHLVKLTARTPAGVFRGVQTIRQLLPPAIELGSAQPGPWRISAGTIVDYPVYSYRGAMLDVARHFFGVEDVKRFIDFLAAYKMNVLHLHLSDDQGWRIEIKSWPNLTGHGGSTEVGGGKGGFYTQEQYADIVRYAGERFITIVPEIDMPGHTNAALASYPELNCSGKATELYTGTNVGFSSLCTTKDITYKFIDDVTRELAALTPGPYIHVGGDESHATKVEDYIPFENKVQDIVIAHGKKVIGWDEIALSKMKPGSMAQDWASVKNAKLAVAQGAKILMSPASKAYADMQYDKTTRLGLNWAGYLEVDSAYSWDPATMIAGITRENIIGVEAALWTETITNMNDIEYMVFPRLPGYAEIGWTPASLRNWDEYKLRLAEQGERFKAMNIDFYPSKLVPWKEGKVIKLWPEGVPGSKIDPAYEEKITTTDGRITRCENVVNPDLTVYLPIPEKATGTAVLICPGGGYGMLAFDHEGNAIARWLNDNGIAGIILKYRLPSEQIMKDKTIGPLQDAQEAMRIIRRNAAAWKINPNRIGVIGFSAGGHLASTLSTHYAEKVYDVKDNTSARPDFSLLIYPVVSFDETITHMGSRNNLIGTSPSEELIKHFSNELQITPETPPAFLVHSADDKAVPVMNSIRYFEGLQKNNIPAEIHIFQKGGHGYGLAPQGGTESSWPSLCMKWLKAMGLN
ncbi:MAG: family 20 glycosylhydrolase [Bacteroidota bacterium]|nr:family 20 glycosylhydrolase [Bacteroidota bacterium]